MAALLPNADPLHKVTIIPRGMALGVTMQLPIDDKHSYNKEYLQAQLAILMAGRIAEEKLHAPHDHRRRQRHRARHRPGPQDGLRVGHERTRSAELRQEGRADLPRPRNRAAPRLQRRDRHPHRRAGEEAGAGRLRHGRRRSSTSTPKRWSRSPRRCWCAKSWTATKCMQIIARRDAAAAASAGPEGLRGSHAAGDPARRRPPRAGPLEGERPQPA